MLSLLELSILLVKIQCYPTYIPTVNLYSSHAHCHSPSHLTCSSNQQAAFSIFFQILVKKMLTYSIYCYLACLLNYTDLPPSTYIWPYTIISWTRIGQYRLMNAWSLMMMIHYVTKQRLRWNHCLLLTEEWSFYSRLTFPDPKFSNASEHRHGRTTLQQPVRYNQTGLQ